MTVDNAENAATICHRVHSPIVAKIKPSDCRSEKLSLIFAPRMSLGNLFIIL